MQFVETYGKPRAPVRIRKKMLVVQLWRYPVKSLGGEPLRSTRLDKGGIPFDRRLAVIDTDPLRAGKPLNGRRQHRLLGYTAAVRDGTVLVRKPAGVEDVARDGGWLAELETEFGQPVLVREFADPLHDDSDVLVLNAASLRMLTSEYGSFVNPLRFRPNLIVDGADAAAFEETAWPGKRFSVGGAVLEVSHLCERCVIPTIDPETLESDPAFLKLIVRLHDGRFGAYCNVVQAGDVRLGDEWRAHAPAEVRS